ncbi:MAG: hypothetical protein LBH09_07980 [Peptococcaceae bacterium]|jgi:hypothetical protein|nr:hypothetical protein [Peptococcaceae bacterium]
MEYFWITPNPDYTDAPRLLDFHDKMDMNDFYFDRSCNMPMRTVIHIHPNEHMDFTDYLYQSVPLFTDKAMKVIWRYDNDFIYKELILLSPQDGLDKLYYLPFFSRFPSDVILEPSSSHLLERSGTVPKLNIPYTIPVFFVFSQHKCLLFMRLDLVESLLRNGSRGFALRKANVCVEG